MTEIEKVGHMFYDLTRQVGLDGALAYIFGNEDKETPIKGFGGINTIRITLELPESFAKVNILDIIPEKCWNPIKEENDRGAFNDDLSIKNVYNKVEMSKHDPNMKIRGLGKNKIAMIDMSILKYAWEEMSEEQKLNTCINIIGENCYGR